MSKKIKKNNLSVGKDNANRFDNTPTISTSRKRRIVDPITGMSSTDANAISYNTFYKRRKVDPITGKPSTHINAITYSKFKQRRKVDPITGTPSNAESSISYNVFHSKRQKRRKKNGIGSSNVLSSKICLQLYDNNYTSANEIIDRNIQVKTEVNLSI